MTLVFEDADESCLFFRPLVEQTGSADLSDRVMADLKDLSDGIVQV